MNDLHSAPRSVVIAFAAAYTAWERAMEVAGESLENQFEDPGLREQHEAILLRYCTHKDRKYTKGYSFSIPPTYGELTEKNINAVEVVTSNRVHVDTKKLSKATYRFVLLKRRMDGELTASSGSCEVNGKIHL